MSGLANVREGQKAGKTHVVVLMMERYPPTVLQLPHSLLEGPEQVAH